MTPKEEQLRHLKELYEMTNKKYASIQDVAKIVVEVGKVLRENNQANDKKIENLVNILERKLQETLNEVESSKSQIEKKFNDSAVLSSETKTLISKLKSELESKINSVEYKIPRQADLTPLQRKIEEVESKIPEVPEIVLDSPQEVRNKLESLKGNDRLDKNSIRGIEELEKEIQSTKSNYSSLASRVIGGLQGLFTYVNGAKKGIIKSLDFVGGTGVTITHSKVNGLDTITFNAEAATITSASNLGSGEGVFAQINSGDAQFKSLVAGTNVTITSDANEITINSTGGGGGSDTWIQEDFTGDTDGVTTDFALSATPKAGSPFMVYMSGVRQRSTFYTVGGGNISFTFAPPEGTELLVDYIEA